MRAQRWIGVFGLVIVALPACTREGTSQTKPNLEQFCTAVVGGEAASSGSAADSKKALALLDRSERVAPADIKKDVTALVAQVRKALSGRATGVFTSPGFERLEERIDRYVAANCRYPEIKIVGKEYAFEGVPKTVKAGRTTFTLTNEGKEVHEMSLLGIDREATESVEELLGLSQAAAAEKLQALNADTALQGETNREVFGLTRGRYALVCFLPTGAKNLEAVKSAKGEPHFKEGMFTEFAVR